jgi:hypothetical protein
MLLADMHREKLTRLKNFMRAPAEVDFFKEVLFKSGVVEPSSQIIPDRAINELRILTLCA